jgi:hypothetical protein
MPSIRRHYLFPQRLWRRTSLLCNGAARKINLRDLDSRAQSAFSARAELHLVRELNCDEIVPDSCLNPHGSKKC